MAEIFTDPRFLTPDRILELREHNDVQVSLASALEGLDLQEPRPGEKVVGSLTPEEATLYRDLYEANAHIEGIAREAMGRKLSQLGETLRQSDRHKPLSEILKDPAALDLASDGEMKSFYRAQQRVNMLHACFYYHLGERLDMHEWRMGVRSRGRVVRIELR